jgi:transposase-like protein
LWTVRRYTEEQKAAALRVIAEKGVYEASVETGISLRTLYEWQRVQRRQTQVAQPESSSWLPNHPDDPEYSEDARADAIIDEVLDQLLEQARVLSKRFSLSFDQASPVSQMMALTRLIDRIVKLDARKPRTGKPMRITVVREDRPGRISETHFFDSDSHHRRYP